MRAHIYIQTQQRVCVCVYLSRPTFCVCFACLLTFLRLRYIFEGSFIHHTHTHNTTYTHTHKYRKKNSKLNGSQLDEIYITFFSRVNLIWDTSKIFFFLGTTSQLAGAWTDPCVHFVEVLFFAFCVYIKIHSQKTRTWIVNKMNCVLAAKNKLL